MATVFVATFIAGLGLSAVSFASVSRVLHLPHFMRHGAVKKTGSMINAAAITAFLTWFGGSGFLLDELTRLALPFVASLAGAIGVSGAAFINSAINALARQESAAEPLSMIGVIGRTVVAIRAGDGTGEIVFTHAGTRRVAGARSESGRAIAKGTEVVVLRYEKGIAYVAQWDELEEEPKC